MDLVQWPSRLPNRCFQKHAHFLDTILNEATENIHKDAYIEILIFINLTMKIRFHTKGKKPIGILPTKKSLVDEQVDAVLLLKKPAQLGT